VKAGLPVQLSYQPYGFGSATRGPDDHYPSDILDQFVPLFWLAVQEGIVALAEATFRHSRREQPKHVEDEEDEEPEDDAIIDGYLGPMKETPLIYACRVGDEKMVRFLIEAHADIIARMSLT
jgi:hypothetical protein